MDTGFYVELREPACRWQGKRHKDDNPRPKVPMRQAGADSSVVVMTWGNAHRAKGGGHQIETTGQRETGGAQGYRWKAAAFGGWHEPDDARVSCPDL